MLQIDESTNNTRENHFSQISNIQKLNLAHHAAEVRKSRRYSHPIPIVTAFELTNWYCGQNHTEDQESKGKENYGEII